MREKNRGGDEERGRGCRRRRRRRRNGKIGLRWYSANQEKIKT